MPTCGYHFTAKAVSFGKGQSAVHTAAYNARVQLHQEREGRETKDYSDRSSVLFSGIFAPPGAPAWAQDREELWNRAEAAERQKDGQPARNLEFAFPHQLNQQQRERLLKDYLREQFVRQGMIADANIHAPHPAGDQRNYHAHVLVTMRKLDGDNFAKTKNREWNRPEQMLKWRERWAEMSARALKRAGYQIEAERWRHGHKTLDAQRKAALRRGDQEYAKAIDREATTHRGPQADAIEREGQETDRGNAHRDAVKDAKIVDGLKKQLASVDRSIEDLMRRRWIAGPQKGGMVEHQAWAMERLKAEDELRRRQERVADREKPTPRKRDSGIDRERLRSDPDYRREVLLKHAQAKRESRARRQGHQPELQRDERQR